jgi:hypothetical protein
VSQPSNVFYTQERLDGSRDINSNFERVSAFIFLANHPKVSALPCGNSVMSSLMDVLVSHAGWSTSGWTSFPPSPLQPLRMHKSSYTVVYVIQLSNSSDVFPTQDCYSHIQGRIVLGFVRSFMESTVYIGFSTPIKETRRKLHHYMMFGWFWRIEKCLALPGFEPRTV